MMEYGQVGRLIVWKFFFKRMVGRAPHLRLSLLEKQKNPPVRPSFRGTGGLSVKRHYGLI